MRASTAREVTAITAAPLDIPVAPAITPVLYASGRNRRWQISHFSQEMKSTLRQYAATAAAAGPLSVVASEEAETNTATSHPLTNPRGRAISSSSWSDQ